MLDYHVMGQFVPKYTADPALELITSVSSELLGFENAEVSYTVEGSAATVTVADGKTVFNFVEYGTVTVTATVTYGNYTASKSVELTFEEPPKFDPITVGEAINTALGEKVVVEGIVGPSLVNQSGFYLVDETGIIAITMTASELEGVEFGQKVILEGTRDRKVKTDDAGNPYDCHGQTQLKDCTVLLNLYGEHSFPTEGYQQITVEEFYALDKTADFTTTVYSIEAYVFVEQYNIKLGNQDGSVKFNLYSSGVAQYSWLKPYGGQKITLLVAPCNWNSKSYYAGCALCAVLEDGTVIYNTLNFDN